MIDRTKELQSTTSEWESLREANRQADIEMGQIAKQEKQTEQSEEWMNSFFNSVTEIQRGLADLQAKMPVIERIHGKILGSVQESEEKKLHVQLEQHTDDASSLAYSLNSMISGLETSMSRQLEQDTSDYRLCYSQYSGLSRKLRSIVHQYQTIQKAYQAKQKTRFSRQYRIINPEATDEDITSMLSTEYQGPIFADSILSATMMDEAKRVLNDVTARHKEILDLTKSIVRLEKLFEELSVMVEQQDDLVNQVAYQTENAKAYLGTTNEVLAQAVKSAESARRRKFCFLILCLVLLGAIAAVIAVVLVPYMKK